MYADYIIPDLSYLERWEYQKSHPTIIAKNAPIGIQVTKEAALKYIEAGEKAAIDYIPKIKDRVFSSEDMKEGIQSFVERRSAVFLGK